jgi:DNA-binding NarL/FixJ family response regulator
VEGHTLYAKALALVLSRNENIQMVAELKRIDEPGLAAANPNLVLIDLDTHIIDLGEALRICRKEVPEAVICVMTHHVKVEVMQRCLSLGVDGFFSKDMDPDEFMRGLRSVAQGMSYVDPRVAGGLLRRRSMRQTEETAEELSLRELDIVRLIADGLSNKEISARLFLSEKTIKNHTARIFLKFGVSARTQVAVHALRAGIV